MYLYSPSAISPQLFPFYKNGTLQNQLKVLKKFPSFYTREEGLEVGKEISLEEIQKVLFRFSKDENPIPNGWTIELFLAFFDIMGKDLLEVAEFSLKE